MSLPVQAGDLEVPNDEELHTLRRVSDKIPFKAYTIAFVELVERMSFYGTTQVRPPSPSCTHRANPGQVFVNFIQQPNPGTRTGKAVDPKATNAQPGALGLGQQASTGLTTFKPVLGVPDPILYGPGAYVAGHVHQGRHKTMRRVLAGADRNRRGTSSSSPAPRRTGHRLRPPPKALAAFIIGLIIMGIGTGGFKPNIRPAGRRTGAEPQDPHPRGERACSRARSELRHRRPAGHHPARVQLVRPP